MFSQHLHAIPCYPQTQLQSNMIKATVKPRALHLCDCQEAVKQWTRITSGCISGKHIYKVFHYLFGLRSSLMLTKACWGDTSQRWLFRFMGSDTSARLVSQLVGWSECIPQKGSGVILGLLAEVSSCSDHPAAPGGLFPAQPFPVPWDRVTLPVPWVAAVTSSDNDTAVTGANSLLSFVSFRALFSQGSAFCSSSRSIYRRW